MNAVISGKQELPEGAFQFNVKHEFNVTDSWLTNLYLTSEETAMSSSLFFSIVPILSSLYPVAQVVFVPLLSITGTRTKTIYLNGLNIEWSYESTQGYIVVSSSDNTTALNQYYKKFQVGTIS